MHHHTIVLPSKPKVVSEEGFSAVFEIEGLYPGYGHTLGNSLRRIILSSLTGSAITSVKITGVDHEFSTKDGIQEDIVTTILNLKKIRIKNHTDEPQTLVLKKKGVGEIKAGDIEAMGQVDIMNPDLVIAHITDKNTELELEMTVEKGLGYVSKEFIQKDKMAVGHIALDAVFTPIRRVNYEVENMRVGDRTDFNRLKIFIETDGTITPREALEKAIDITIRQLKSIIGFKEEDEDLDLKDSEKNKIGEGEDEKDGDDEADSLKTRIESLDISQRTLNALTGANIRTVGGLVRKKEQDILDIEGLGEKGLEEIKKVLKKLGVALKE